MTGGLRILGEPSKSNIVVKEGLAFGLVFQQAVMMESSSGGVLNLTSGLRVPAITFLMNSNGGI